MSDDREEVYMQLVGKLLELPSRHISGDGTLVRLKDVIQVLADVYLVERRGRPAETQATEEAS